jgi:class 3 adenylate cyclase/tetratricopeptide (TPR) repeat protein
MVTPKMPIDRAAERKVVTVLFADLTGSTALGERLDPERLHAVLDTYFRAMASVIEAWGGTVEKYIGDAVMAVFGVPAVREDDAQRAIRSGLEMLDRLRVLNTELQASHGVELEIRIGINSGEVMAPVAGPVEQMIVAGDAVNVAARLEQAAAPGTILVGERTYLPARADIRFDSPLSLEVHGKTQPVSAYRVLGLRQLSSDRSGRAGRPQTQLVGRDRDLSTLLGLFDEAIDSGRPRLALVTGPAGIGKSRLVGEFAEAVEGRPAPVAVFRGRCLAAGRGVTYGALGELLRQACGISLDASAESARGLLSGRAGDILRRLSLPDDEAEEAVHALGATAGITYPDDALDRLEPRAVFDRIARAWPTFATALASERPTLFLIEDLHWAGEPLLEMIDRLIVRSTGPLLIVATARPELGETHPTFLAGRGDVSTTALRRLTDDQSQALMDGLLPDAQWPVQLRGEVLAKAEGNPFFLEEIVQRLVDEGAVVDGPEGGRIAVSGATSPLPDTIYALLASRIDALPPTEKRVLQAASVVGRNFWQDPVVRTLGDIPIGTAIETLEARGMILALPTSTIAGHPEYLFRHTLVRDVAFSSLPKARRARAHAEIGRWLAEMAGDRPEALAELVAHHYREAVLGEDADLAWLGDPARDEIQRTAFRALLIAGTVKQRLFAIESAIDLHGDALRLAAGDAEQVAALEALGDDHVSAYHGDDAVSSYDRALELAGAPERGPDRARLCRKVASMMAVNPGSFRVTPDPALAEAYIARGLAAVEDDVERAWLLLARGACARLWRGAEPFGQGLRPDPMTIQDRISAAEQARSIAVDRDLPDLLGAADAALGILYGIAGDYAAVLTVGRRQLDRLAEIPSRLQQADTLRTIAVHTVSIVADFEEGLELARRAHRLAANGSPHQRMHATWPILAALYYLGRWDESLLFVEEHMRAFGEDAALECQFVRDGPVIGATIHAERGEPERARALAAAVGDPLGRVEGATAFEARLAIAIGDPASARTISRGKALEGRLYGPQHALTLLDALIAEEAWSEVADLIPKVRAAVAGNALLEPWCDRAQGFVALQAGRPADAAESFRRAIETFGRLKVPFEAARTEMLLAPLAAAEGLALVASAQATFARLGVPTPPPAT